MTWYLPVLKRYIECSGRSRLVPARGRLVIPLLLLLTGCFSAYTVTARPAQPFDAVIVPGCPSEADGSPTRCQLGHAGHAAMLWREGWTRTFIVSGSDVHTPYVEAEAIAQAMTVLGIPADRIYLERDALHSDENVYYSLLLAQRAGLERLAIASYGPIPGMLCAMMVQWGHACSALEADTDALETLMPPYEHALLALRARRVQSWEPLGAREERIARANGHGRPPSWWLYAFYGSLGPSHRPIPPAHAEVMTWAAREEQLAASRAAGALPAGL